MTKRSYIEQEREKVIKNRNSFFKDPGNGMFLGKKREFVLKDPYLNLWESIREDAIEYFDKNSIPWWDGNGKLPSGHLLSSQVACVNHLYFIRQRKDLATAILKNIDNEITGALIVDDGYTEFEFIGSKPFLGEKSFTRGANCTSVDAVMIGENKKGKRKFFLIEWKYTEHYAPHSKYIRQRAEIYDPLIINKESPFIELKPEKFYYEPFYQLMRQTLLGWKLVEHNDYGCTDYYTVHVIPKENYELLSNITSPGLYGNTISESWKSVLKEPDKYMTIAPNDLLSPCFEMVDTQSWLLYLRKRYW